MITFICIVERAREIRCPEAKNTFHSARNLFLQEIKVLEAVRISSRGDH